MAKIILTALVAGLIGYRFGWERAHIVVAKECKVLGGFFVAGETFKCTLVTSQPEEQS